MLVAGILYISYDGMLEPLGQSQVLAYLCRFPETRHVHLISFEKKTDWLKTADREALSRTISAAGITWHPLRYHKRLSILATAWDIACGVVVARRLVRRYGLHIIHARSYVPALIALLLKRLSGVHFVFDMRGFWADERVDGGLWPRNGVLFRVAKWCERRFLLSADWVVSLTHAAVRIIRNFEYLKGRVPRFSVIPTCADLDRFKPETRVADAPFTLGYVGTVGTWYMFEEVASTVAHLLRLRPGSRFLVINRNEHAMIRQRLAASGIPRSAVEIVSAEPAEMPSMMARMDAGIFFIKPLFSKQASAPTKLAEFLGCGIPCLSNHGVGDMAEVLESERVGIAVRSFDQGALEKGLVALMGMADDSTTRARCVAAAHKHFALQIGVEGYLRIYETIEQQHRQPEGPVKESRATGSDLVERTPATTGASPGTNGKSHANQ